MQNRQGSFIFFCKEDVLLKKTNTGNSTNHNLKDYRIKKSKRSILDKINTVTMQPILSTVQLFWTNNRFLNILLTEIFLLNNNNFNELSIFLFYNEHLMTLLVINFLSWHIILIFLIFPFINKYWWKGKTWKKGNRSYQNK